MRGTKVFQRLTVAFAIAVTGSVQAEGYHLVLVGSGGTAEYTTKFQEWGERLRAAIVTQLEAPADQVAVLTETGSVVTEATTGIDRETIAAAFSQLQKKIGPDEDLYVYLIGHGSYIKDESNFHIPGPDLTARELDALLESLGNGTTIVINSTSSSAGFINELSAPDRIICTATKNVSEVNATEFMRFFIEAIEEGSADRNHDERISVLEACEQAAELTASWYSSENLIATEHAILDDNGDGLGSRLPIDVFFEESDDTADGGDETPDHELDGALAMRTYMKDFSFPENAPQELIDRYLDTLDAVEALKRRRDAFTEDAYFLELEKLFLDAARANREIRSYRTAPPGDS